METNYYTIPKRKSFIYRLSSAKSSIGRIMGITAAAILVVCILFTLASQIVHPGYNPLQDAISVLVWGPGGWLQTAAFLLLALSVIILGIRMYLKTRTSLAFKIGVMFLILMGIGSIIVSFNPTDIPGSPQTFTGVIHMITAGSLLFLFPIACFLMAPYMKKHFRQKWIGIYTYAAGALSFVLIAVIAVLVLGDHGFLGTMERLIMVNGLMWLQVMHIHTL